VVEQAVQASDTAQAQKAQRDQSLAQRQINELEKRIVDLVVIRHAIAETREAFAETGEDDSLRPLIPKGVKRMQRAVRGLRVLIPHIDVVATSPYVRAAQTADIVAEGYPNLTPIVLDGLVPGGERRSVLSWLQMQREDATIAIVGHEPSLGSMVSWFLASRDSHFLELKKGGVCRLAWPTHVTAGDAHLLWMLEAGQLRRIGKGKGINVSRGLDP
jgi:phosphohistidine phosphatase